MVRLKIGFTLLIIWSIPALGAWVSYTVKKGDTLSEIGKRSLPHISIWGRNGSVEMIYRKNKGVIDDKNLILVGQTLLIPGASLAETKPKVTESGADKPSRHPASEDTALGLLKAAIVSSLWDRSLTDKTSGAKGTMRSKAIAGILIEGHFPVSKAWSIDSGVQYRNIEFTPAKNRALVQESKTYMEFRLGAIRKTESCEWGLGIQYEQLPLVTGVSSSEVGVTSFNVTSPYLMGSWRIHSYGKTSVWLAGKFTYNLNSTNESYKLESGQLIEVALPLNRKISDTFSFGLSPFVEYGKRETNTVKHTGTNIGIQLDFSWAY